MNSDDWRRWILLRVQQSVIVVSPARTALEGSTESNRSAGDKPLANSDKKFLGQVGEDTGGPLLATNFVSGCATIKKPKVYD